jgi:hypothetical protein
MSIKGREPDVKKKMKKIRRAGASATGVNLSGLFFRLANSLAQHDFLGRDQGIGWTGLSIFATTGTAATTRVGGHPGTEHPPDQVQGRPGHKNNDKG